MIRFTWNTILLLEVPVRSFVLALALLLSVPAHAQQITRDSLFDHVDSYWRGRLTVTASSGDSISITCDWYGPTWYPTVRFFAAAPWSPDAISTTTSTIFGFGSSNTGSRLTVMWPGNDRDEWKITFMSNSSTNIAGRVSTDATAASRAAGDARSGWLNDGQGFLQRLVKHGRLAITYPSADWVRSFELVFSDEQRAALKGMYDRCTTKYEGTQRKSSS